MQTPDFWNSFSQTRKHQKHEGRSAGSANFNKWATWAFEIALQAFLISVVAILAMRDGDPVSGKDLFVITITVLFVFMISGYAITTLLTRVFWAGQRLWSYSVVAAALFLIHFEVMNRLVLKHGSFTPTIRPTARLGGACIAFLCTFLGSFGLHKQIAARDRAENRPAPPVLL